MFRIEMNLRFEHEFGLCLGFELHHKHTSLGFTWIKQKREKMKGKSYISSNITLRVNIENKDIF